MTAAEIISKLQDPRYFIERFFHIVDKRRVRVPFRLNRPQEKYYENHTPNDLILKARKEGFSSLIEALWLHACMFNKNENVVTMAHTLDDTLIHLDRVKYFMENMGVSDMPIRIQLDKENQRELFFPRTYSRYWIGTAGAKAFGRGRDITRLHLSEVAHYPDEAVITGVMEACVPGAWKVLETTANGIGETFHRLWQEANDPHSGSPWKAHFFPWFEDPENRVQKPTDRTVRLTSPEERLQKKHGLEIEQVLWYRHKRAEMTDKDLMPQEYPSDPQEAFLSSGRPAFNLTKLAEKKERVKAVLPLATGEVEDDGKEIKFRNDTEGRFRIWKMPRRGAMYIVSGDSCEGVPGGDFAVMQVFDRSSWEQVAVWRARIDPGDFGREMVKVGYFFNNAVLIPELNNHGWATVEAIQEEEYPHLLNTKEIWGDKETIKDGFPQTEKTREKIITALRNAIDKDTVFFNDVISLGEMETFVRSESNGKFEAQKGHHDDCVTTAAIGAYCLGFLTVDESYGEHVTGRRGPPIVLQSLVGGNRNDNQQRRRSATGYR